MSKQERSGYSVTVGILLSSIKCFLVKWLAFFSVVLLDVGLRGTVTWSYPLWQKNTFTTASLRELTAQQSSTKYQTLVGDNNNITPVSNSPLVCIWNRKDCKALWRSITMLDAWHIITTPQSTYLMCLMTCKTGTILSYCNSYHCIVQGGTIIMISIQQNIVW